jgi:hypothetical protein
MVFTTLTSKETYFYTFDWFNDSFSSGGPIFSCGVTPMTHSIVDLVPNRVWQPTTCAFVATPFNYWRGDMIYRIEVVCSAYHRGKLLILYEPNASAYSTLINSTATNKQYSFILDLQETQSVEFCVKWANTRPWCMVSRNLVYSSLVTFESINIDERFCNGYFTIVPFTSLQSPDGSDVEVNIYTRCENLQVNYPTRNHMPNRRLVTESAIITESEVLSPNVKTLSPVPVTCVVLNESSANLQHLTHQYFGEAVFSFRSLLRRYTTTKSVLTTSATAQNLLYDGNRVVPNNLPYGSSGVVLNDLLSYLRYAYMGSRGSLRKRIMIRGLTGNSEYGLVRVSNGSSTTAIPTEAVTYTTFNAFNGFAKMEGSVSFIPHSNGGIEFELPYYSNNLFDFAFNSNPTVAFASNNFYVRSYNVSMDTPVHTNVAFTEDTAIGEDFMFLRFQGAPFWVTTA